MVRIVKEWDTLSAREKVARVLGQVAYKNGFRIEECRPYGKAADYVLSFGEATKREGVARLFGDRFDPTVMLLDTKRQAEVETLLAEAEKEAGVEIILVVRE